MKKIIALLCAAVLVFALCACGSNGGSSTAAKPLSEVFEEIKAQVTFPDVIEISDPSKLDRYYGIAAEEVAECAGCISSSGTEQTEVMLVKAADDASAEKIKGIFDNKYDSKLNENRDYNPEQAAMIEKCEVKRDGLYVSMIISPDAETITKIYNEGIGVK